VERNRIGISLDGSMIPNGVFGVRIVATQSKIGPDNLIAYNPTGIQIEGDISVGNTITRNSIFNNTGLGIDLVPLTEANSNDVDDVDSGPNGLLNYPLLHSATPAEVVGSACVSCIVEIYVADEKNLGFGEGKTFVGSGVAGADGTFTIPLASVVFGDYLTATATDSEGNTSEFSRNILVNNPANAAPVAVDDSASTFAGTPVTIDVLTNDTDPDGDALTVVALGEAANGELFTNGAFVVYTPTATFGGVEVFTYTASDSIGGASVATVTVSVEMSTTITAGIQVNPSAITVTAGGPPASYSIVLEGEPAAPVTAKIIADGQLTVDPTELLFDAANWNVPQTISVSVPPVEEAQLAAEGDYQSTIRHQINSADANYNNIGTPNLVVYVSLDTEPQQADEILYVPMIMR
jgi:hypothetical protein